MSRSSMAADGRGGGVEFRGRVRDRVEGGGVNSRRGNGTINVGGRERGRTFLAGGSERGMSRERVGRWLEGEDLQEKERGGRKDSEGRGEGADGGETDKESQKLVERAREFLVAMTNNTGYEVSPSISFTVYLSSHTFHTP